MEHRYDPTRSMRWYKGFQVLLIIHILADFVQLWYAMDQIGIDFALGYDFAITLLFLVLFGSTILDLLLLIALFRYSERAPDLCIAMLAFSVIMCVSLIVAFDTQTIDGFIGYLIGQFILYCPTYFYLRKRLVKKYWADQSNLAAKQSNQETTNADATQPVSSEFEKTASSDTDTTHFI